MITVNVTSSPGERLTIRLHRLASIPTRHHNSETVINKCLVGEAVCGWEGHINLEYSR